MPEADAGESGRRCRGSAGAETPESGATLPGSEGAGEGQGRGVEAQMLPELAGGGLGGARLRKLVVGDALVSV